MTIQKGLNCLQQNRANTNKIVQTCTKDVTEQQYYITKKASNVNMKKPIYSGVAWSCAK